ncbi:MAG TPA: DUF1800 domain-containing protein [Planctomycetaceae bacterium]|nr:DUF1800 domain-containing protein [Planctomycetaceae bacterium]
MARKFFEPFAPDTANPFDARKAAHLLRRAGFGAPPAQVAAAVERGLEATIDELFADADDEEQEFQRTFNAINGKLVNAGDPGVCQSWWVYRMLTTRVPLREKLTLFWHGHFATSIHKVEDTQLMLQQIETLRRLGFGSFRELVVAVARDPAMIVWLDGEANNKEHPNENFARELMELFTCGIGNYMEKDVLEAARAFSGWHRAGTTFSFNAAEHDQGVKNILGRRGKFDGGDVIDLLMAQPATPRFIARKLLRFFALPNPPDDVVAEAAELYDRTQLNTRLFLRELFQSQYFFSDDCVRTRIASPVEFVIGTVRTLNVRQSAADLIDDLNSMGQELLAPPNVKGWDGEEKWINSTTLAARLTYARSLPEKNSEGNSFNPHCPVEQFVPLESKSPASIVEKLSQLLLQGEISPETRGDLEKFLTAGDDGPSPEAFRDDEGFRATKVRQLLGVMLALPEYQAY